MNDQAELEFINTAVEEAKKATCQRDKCGSVIVKDAKIIGKGYNSPPSEQEDQRRCSQDKILLHKKVTDKTCCVHAEQRAIFDALINYSDKIKGSTLYFVRLNNEGVISFAGKPYCTICSKMALDCGIKYFVLYHKEGLKKYETGEYNLLSYQYSEE